MFSWIKKKKYYASRMVLIIGVGIISTENIFVEEKK